MNVQKALSLTELQEGTRSNVAKAASTDERLLVAQAKSGRSSAFGKLYELHRVGIYHAAFRILRNRQDAEDAVQRSFQRAFHKPLQISRRLHLFHLGNPHSYQ